MSSKEKIAQAIRIITVPPILIILLIIILSIIKKDIFRGWPDQTVSLLLLGFVPALAYVPLSSKPEKTGREQQRKLAFVWNMAGYTLAVIYGYVSNAEKNLQLIFLTYFLSVLILTFFNKVLHVRASGHACSATGPLLTLVYFIGWKALVPCLLVGAASVWGSLALKRHTKRDLLAGIFICMIAFQLARWILF